MNIFGTDEMRGFAILPVIWFMSIIEIAMIDSLNDYSLLSNRQINLSVFYYVFQFPFFGVLALCLPDFAIISCIICNIIAGCLVYRGWRKWKHHITSLQNKESS